MRETDDALESYLAHIVDGAPVRTPESGLEPMLRVARQLRRLGSIEPSAASVERTRVALRRGAAGEGGARSATPRLGLWRRPVMGLAFAVVLLTLGTTSVFAAPSALPNSPLYPVRNWREAVQVQLAGSPAQRAVLYVNFAGQRTTQLRGLAGQKDVAPDLITTLLRDITARVRQANQEAQDGGPAARSAVGRVEGQIGNQLTQIQQEGEFSGNDGAQLADTLRTVQSGQSGQSGDSSNNNNNQP